MFPSHDRFRSDMTAEEVMHGLMKLKDSQAKSQFLQYIGFEGSAIPSLVSSSKDIPLYEQLADADDFASTPVIAKSCSARVISELLQLTSANSGLDSVEEGSELMHVLRAHFVALLADEMNVVSALYNAQDERLGVRLPKVTISLSGS